MRAQSAHLSSFPKLEALNGKTVISFTPTALEADSRTLKQASSLVRSGARSIVVEGRSSRQSFDRLGIELVSTAEQSGAEPPAAKLSPTASLDPNRSAGKTESSVKNAAIFILTLLHLSRKVWWRAYGLCPRADVAVLHSFHFLPTALALRARYGTRIVYDAHDFYPEIDVKTDANGLERGWLQPMYNQFDAITVRSAAAFITVSEGLADLFENRYGRRPAVIRNVHDRRLDFRPLNETVRTRCGIGPDVTLIVTVGNAKKGAAIAQLIQAVSKMSDRPHIAFVGNGYEGYAPIAEQYGIRDRVHICGAVPADHVVPYIETADIAAIPYFAATDNYRQALPNGFFQSIAAELPLIYPPLEQIRLIADQFDLGILCDMTSADGITAAYYALRDSRSKPDKQDAHMEAARHLSWEREEVQFLTILAESVHSARA